ncbi:MULTISPECIES: ActS/PrrB/RegB family redox-sensitive histidine kinase [unclassified Minwuia]|jgi:two-component system, sensor histidine kinase RegB|uniref:ActS/PrrB/RegB family redox-sensitive histidine kinase n=1 Tax=unclassified Minwuia TaxID=2618799 RepID=UPI002479556D|nr:MULTISPECIES: ActS/PrrB/RegB family redox-sensitive histidine kinase [unclassified Minwuia]
MNDRQMAIQDLFVVGTSPGVSGSGRVRLQTLVLIRWIAVLGQSFSVLLIRFGLDFEFPFLPCLLTILASGVLNIVLAVQYPATARLSDRGAALFLAYDLLQLAALLYMTGGLTNPFVILILVPVTISATILSVLSTAALGLLALVFTSLLAFWYLPLPWAGAGLHFPTLYVGAIWMALALGIAFMSTYAGRLAFETKRMSDALRATQLALSREQQLSAVGGIAAAAAHELGTPLGTIHLVARELQRDLETGSPLTEDIDLLVSQTERCRDILAELSRRPGDGDDTFRKTTIVGLVEAAVEPYGTAEVSIVIEPQTGHPPEVPRSPEVLHGLANLTENAVDFSRRQVRIEIYWDTPEITILLEDDGPGFPQDVLKTLGEPYTTTRRQRGGMGLGVFIATTLLGHSGATVDFSNRVENGVPCGARVAIRWPHGIIEQGTWG